MSNKVKFTNSSCNPQQTMNNRAANIKKRKRLVDKINKIESYTVVYEVGEILASDKVVQKDKSSYTINNNGFHMRISKLSDETITKLDNYFIAKSNKNNPDIDSEKLHKGSIFNYLTENSTEETNVRLSSKEKKFFKKMQNNAI
jgi:hypothetical protein